MFSECAKHLKGHSTFFGNRLILPELNSWVLPFSNPFSQFNQTVIRQFLVPLTSIVVYYGSQCDQKLSDY